MYFTFFDVISGLKVIKIGNDCVNSFVKRYPAVPHIYTQVSTHVIVL